MEEAQLPPSPLMTDSDSDPGSLYRGVLLSPMVRCGTLPLRLLSLEYGADAVYTHELIDRKLCDSVRVENPTVGEGCVDFVRERDQALVFRTCAAERAKVICQIGSANANTALQAARLVANDVAAIDLNMGCPKHFSVQGGMGAALLRTPERACDIIKTLRRNLDVPISCKIRLLETEAKTIQLVQALVAAGAVAVGVHMRETHERPKDRAHWERLRPIVDCVDVPIVANGDVWKRSDIDAVREISGCAGVMVARGALRNPSIFRSAAIGGALPLDDVVRRYMDVAAEWSYPFSWRNGKYCVQQMMRENKVLGSVLGAALTRTKRVEDIVQLWDVRGGNGGADAAIAASLIPGNKKKRRTSSALCKGGAPIKVVGAVARVVQPKRKWRRMEESEDEEDENEAAAAAVPQQTKPAAEGVVNGGDSSAAPPAAAASAAAVTVTAFEVHPRESALRSALRIELEFSTSPALRGRRVRWRFRYIVDATRKEESPTIELGRSDAEHVCSDGPAYEVFALAALKTGEVSVAALCNVGIVEASLCDVAAADSAPPLFTCAVVVNVTRKEGDDATLLRCFAKT